MPWNFQRLFSLMRSFKWDHFHTLASSASQDLGFSIFFRVSFSWGEKKMRLGEFFQKRSIFLCLMTWMIKKCKDIFGTKLLWREIIFSKSWIFASYFFLNFCTNENELHYTCHLFLLMNIIKYLTIRVQISSLSMQICKFITDISVLAEGQCTSASFLRWFHFVEDQLWKLIWISGLETQELLYFYT